MVFSGSLIWDLAVVIVFLPVRSHNVLQSTRRLAFAG